MKKRTAVLVLLLTATLLFTACGPETQPANAATTVPDTTIETTTTKIEEISTEATTAETTTMEETSTEAPAPVPPKGKAAILAAYTKVVDKVKIDMPQYVSNDWQTMSNVDMSGFTYGLISPIAKQFLETREQSHADTHSAGGHAKWFAMPTNELKAGCVLTDTSKIESASCVKSGDSFVITITLATEKDPTRDMANPASVSGWHGKMFDVIDIVEVTEVAKNLGFNEGNAYCTFQGTATLKYNPGTDECIALDHIIDVRIFLGSGAAKVIADYHFYDFKW